MLVAAVAGALGACSDGFGTGFDQADGTGSIALNATVDASLANARSRAEYSDITSDSLSMRLTSASGKEYLWDRVSEFDAAQAFPVGTYTLEVFYGDGTSEGFECPYYYGSSTVNVKENETARVSVTAALANALLDVTYSDNFKAYMTQWSAEVHSAGGSYFEYPDSETRPIYTRAGQVAVNVGFTKPNGNSAKLEVASFEAKPKYFYHVNVDVSNADGSGDAMLIVSFNDDLTEQVIEIDISDEVMNAPRPEVTLDAAADNVELVGGSQAGFDVLFNVIAYGGLKDVVLTTESASLIEQGWPAEVSLISEGFSGLEKFGFSALGLTKPDKMAVIDITKVIPHISYVESAPNTVFSVLAKDNYGKVSDVATFTVVSEPLSMQITGCSYYYGEGVINIDVIYNGDNTDLIKFEYYDKGYGVWVPLTDAVFTPADTKNVYKVTAAIDPVIGDFTDKIQVRATLEGVGSTETSVDVTPMLVVDTKKAVNAFAKYAYIYVTSKGEMTDEILDGVTIYAAADGGEFTPLSATREGSLFRIEGLTPGAEYVVKAVNKDQNPDDVSMALNFDTEEARDVENGAMENWSSYQIKKGTLITYSCTVYNCEGWATFNDLTASEDALTRANAAVSSTLSNDSGHDGKCALIQSAGFRFTSNDVGERSHGELFLGKYDHQGPVYGIDFASRPSSLSFYYKYSPVATGNMGYAEISVLDNAGNVISKNQTNLEKADAFTPVTLDLSYTKDSAKAASISVIFRSTYDPANFVNATDIKKPSFILGSATSTATGSKLYVDDIVLNY